MWSSSQSAGGQCLGRHMSHNVDHNKFEHGCRIFAGSPSSFVLGLEVGHVPTFWLLLYLPARPVKRAQPVRVQDRAVELCGASVGARAIIHMGGCQNYGPLLGHPNTRCRIMIRSPKGTIIFTTTHIWIWRAQASGGGPDQCRLPGTIRDRWGSCGPIGDDRGQLGFISLPRLLWGGSFRTFYKTIPYYTIPCYVIPPG